MTNEHWVEMYLKNIYYMYFLFSFLNPVAEVIEGGGGGHALIHQRWNLSFINRQNLLSSNKRCKIQSLPTLKINWYLDLMIKNSHYGMNAIGLKYYHIYNIYIYINFSWEKFMYGQIWLHILLKKLTWLYILKI